MKILEALAWAKSLDVAGIDRQILLLHCLQRPTHDKAFLLAHDQDEIDPHQERCFKDLISRRLAKEPVAYLTGVKEFYGLEFKVNEATLIPRPDTETLVDWALECLALEQTQPEQYPKNSRTKEIEPIRILDLGTGSGCIAISLKKMLPSSLVWAVDKSAEALEVARANAATHLLPINFLQGSWFDALSKASQNNGLGRQSFGTLGFDLIVSNPPYIAPLDPHLAELSFEPHSALVSEAQGLGDIQEILISASKHLKPGGWLLLEHGFDQGERVNALFHEFGFKSIQSRSDLAGICRCTGGRRAKNGIIDP